MDGRGEYKKAPNCHFEKKSRFRYQVIQHNNPGLQNHTNKDIIIIKNKTFFLVVDKVNRDTEEKAQFFLHFSLNFREGS